ncbi:MAG: fused MFS/spermidine synthase [Anaerolineales bacterium]|nr:fused MFS/spermidine synthase [Anaerolineales bacterium]
MTNLARSSLWLYVLFALSGAAGLGYQMVWVRMLAAGLGHETPAMLGVASAFLGGLAVGGWIFDRRIAHAENPARWYAAIEVVIAGAGVITALTIPWMNELALRLAGPSPSPLLQWLIVFVLPFVTLLPATAAMGATFPVMECFLARWSGGERWVGAVYAVNTFGAVLGTLGSVFLLMPAIGFRGSLFVLATMNLVCAAIAWANFGRAFASGEKLAERSNKTVRVQSKSGVVAAWVSEQRALVTLFFTGWIGIGFQFVVVRGLSQVLENTAYTYASALAVYLVGTSLGAALYQRRYGKLPGEVLLGRLLVGVALVCGAALLVLPWTGQLYPALRASLGDSLTATVVSWFLAHLENNLGK